MFGGTHVFTASSDIPDDWQLRLVVLPPDAAQPAFEQLFVSRPAVGDAPALSGIDLDRRVYRLRKRARREHDAEMAVLARYAAVQQGSTPGA